MDGTGSFKLVAFKILKSIWRRGASPCCRAAGSTVSSQLLTGPSQRPRAFPWWPTNLVQNHRANFRKRPTRLVLKRGSMGATFPEGLYMVSSVAGILAQGSATHSDPRFRPARYPRRPHRIRNPPGLAAASSGLMRCDLTRKKGQGDGFDLKPALKFGGNRPDRHGRAARCSES